MYILMYICIILVELVEKCTIGGRGSAHHNGQLCINLHQKLCNECAYVVRLRGSAELECRFCITFYIKFCVR